MYNAMQIEMPLVRCVVNRKRRSSMKSNAMRQNPNKLDSHTSSVFLTTIDSAFLMFAVSS